MRLVQEHDRIAAGMNDIVVHRLFSAGLSLETALGLMGDQPWAAKVQDAIGGLDLAIRDFRNVLFDHHRPDPPHGDLPGCLGPKVPTGTSAKSLLRRPAAVRHWLNENEVPAPPGQEVLRRPDSRPVSR